jgi:hypothetical protein
LIFQVEPDSFSRVEIDVVFDRSWGNGATRRCNGQQRLRYAMSLPVATTLSGIDSMEVLDQNFGFATNFLPFTAAELKELRDQCRPFAADGRYELFKMTTKYDGKVGREQHHFPNTEELPRIIRRSV